MLLGLILQEYFAIVESLIRRIPIDNGRIILNSGSFYTFLDKNLYIKRNEKLRVYRQLNMIVCNSNSFTSVIYDKSSKKNNRKIVLNIDTYKLLKALYTTNIN